MRRALGFAVLAALVLGCGSAGGGTATTGLKGRVMRGPITPVCRSNQPCDEPARGVRLLFYRSGKLAALATTDQRGWYRIALRAGSYTVRTNRRAPENRLSPSRVTVPRDRFKRVDLYIDTGIR
jgi:hypothetical protein